MMQDDSLKFYKSNLHLLDATIKFDYWKKDII